jgi:lipopolysaccharide/colanic/teichoic acid biosynthesis glycosyltransferase
MTLGGKKTTVILFLGDLLIFVSSLWVMLLIRYLGVPSAELFSDHLIAFGPLFVVWVLIFYIAGLYSKRAIFFKAALWRVILQTQLINIIIAALYFFLLPEIGLAPKTNLVLYLAVSLVFIALWRIALFPKLSTPTMRDRAAVIGEGKELQELVNEVNGNPRYPLQFEVVRLPSELTTDQSFQEFSEQLTRDHITMLVVDTEHESMHPLLPKLYELAFMQRGYQLTRFYDVYEEVFDRVPVTLLQYDWFLKNISSSASNFYDVLKRTIDVIGALVMGIITVIAIPFVFLAQRLEGKGPLFIFQMRIGQDGSRVLTYKFRTMQQSDAGVWLGETENKVTRVGNFLRKTSLDEFPQFINVLRGELSLVGPRNDMEALGLRLAEAIPYYNIRYLVKPGITGWAQINQQYEPGNISPQSIEETKMRLAYDFYYIKNRSFALDMVIALKTMKRMFFRVSSW